MKRSGDSAGNGPPCCSTAAEAPAATKRSAVPALASTTERASEQNFSLRGGTAGSTRTTEPSLASQIRSSGKRIVNVCTERQRGMCSASRSGSTSSFARPFMRAARLFASATRRPSPRSRPGRPSSRGQASADAELAAATAASATAAASAAAGEAGGV